MVFLTWENLVVCGRNVAGRYEINGKKIYGKEILKNPTKYFTDDIMNKLDTISKAFFLWNELN